MSDLIPAEAVRAVAVILRAWEVDQSGEGDIAPVAEFDADALELLTAAAPFLAEYIAARLRAESRAGSAEAPGRQQITYEGGLRRAARLAREAFPKETDRG